jgi:hypothetical protein
MDNLTKPLNERKAYTGNPLATFHVWTTPEQKPPDKIRHISKILDDIFFWELVSPPLVWVKNFRRKLWSG